MTRAAYEAIDAVNWSRLKVLEESPLHYRHRLTNPRTDTPALALGRAAHTAILEPDSFPLEYAVWEGGRRAGKDWDTFEAANAGRTILKAEEYALCLGIRDAVRSNPVAAPYLRAGEAEKTIRWTDKGTHLDCKARVDFLNLKHADGPVLVDVKTSGSVNQRVFGNIAARLGYHKQFAFYHMGVRAMLRLPFLRCVVVAAEQKPPHDVAVFVVDPGHLEIGRDAVMSLLVRLKYHLGADTWPGRYTEEQPLELPEWVGGSDITFDEE